MKKIFALLALMLSCLHTSPSLAQSIDLRGEVTLAPSLASHLVRGGVLYVYVRQYDPSIEDPTRNMPLAVWRLTNPRFPQAFHLTEKNLLSQESPLKGKLLMMAKYAPAGDAIQRSGALYGLDLPQHQLEDTQKQDIVIELNTLFD